MIEASADEPEEAGNGRGKSRHRILSAVAAAVLSILILIVLPPLISWQRLGEARALSLSNMRRLGLATLLYTQDWDGLTMPPATSLPGGRWRTWPQTLRPYVASPETFSDPANPVEPFHSLLRHPTLSYTIDSSYALNRRLWDTFSPGPFPFNNLEMPEQTALLVEAGPMWANPLRASERARFGLLDYGDIGDTFRSFWAYPSPHNGRMAIVAADGHGLLITAEHYVSSPGEHDRLYGRIGGNIYNWNGGHPNGETDRPPRE